jgi:subtilisin family serine protease
MIRTAADLGQVINLSWATEVDYKSVHQAINYALSKDVVVVAAADNDQSAPDAKFYPAAYPGVLAVNAVKADGTPLQPNNHESWIGLAAPGEQITALAPVGGYGVWSGTSFATALVSGVVALVRARYPTLRGPQVVQRLVSTAVPLGAPKDQVGAGMVDPFAALTAQGLSGSGASATPTGSPVAGGSVAVAPRPAAAESIAHRWGTMLAWGGVLGLAAILAYLARIATRSALRRRWRAGGGPLPEESPYAQPMDPPNVRLL